MGDDKKPTNPKELISNNKISTSCIPDTVIVALAAGMTEGALKYGRHNYRIAGAKSSVYKDAHDRHMLAYWNGQDIDPDSGLPHLWKAINCLAILIDASVCGVLVDDRPPKAPIEKMMKDLEPKIAELCTKYSDKKPYHYTIKDEAIPLTKKGEPAVLSNVKVNIEDATFYNDDDISF